MSMTDELIKEGVREGAGDEDGQPAREASEVRDRDFDYCKTAQHRPFSTSTPGAKTDDELGEDDPPETRKSRGGRFVLLALGLIVFLTVATLALVYFVTSGSRGRNRIDAGSEGQRSGEERARADAKREADQALKAVTETATVPAPPRASGAGDLSAPVMPDPNASTGYDPRSVSPYATSPQPGASPTSPESASSGRTTSPADPYAPSDSAGGGAGAADSGGARQSRGAAPTGSYYFFPREAAPPPQDSPRQDGPPALPDRPAAAPRRGESGGAPVKPTFGTLLPVRLLDSVVTMRDGGVIRLETTRAVSGAGGWSVARGTTVVAKLAGGSNDRAFMKVVGFIDAGTNRLVNVGGEVKGSDGADGLRGERKRASSIWSRVAGPLASAGVQLGSAFLLGRGGSAGGHLPVPSQYGAQDVLPAPSRANGNLDFIHVRAGAQGFVMVTDLPDSVEGRDAATLNPTGQLSDDELARLLTEGTPAEIRAALPRMNPELRKLAETVLAQEGQGKGQK